jgi:type IV secretion system protein VirD4
LKGVVANLSEAPQQAAVTPFARWTRDGQGRLVPLESAPHVGCFAPPGMGKTSKWLAQSAVMWPAPALVSSSKDDLMQTVASRRGGPIAMIDLRPKHGHLSVQLACNRG